MPKSFLCIVVLCLLTRRSFAQHKDAILLSSAKFATGNDPGWSSFSFDDRGWNNIRPGTVWQEQGFPDYHGYAWYRIHVVIPSALKQNGHWRDSLRLFLAHVNDVDETWLNGVRIGKTGAYPDDPGGYISQWPAIREYHVTATNKAIRWDAENVIAIKVYDDGGTGGIFMGSPYIDMLEKTDGLVIAPDADSIRYTDAEASVPLTLTNTFNTSFTGTLKIRFRDAIAKRDVLERTMTVGMMPFATKTVRLPAPNRSGIELSYTFSQFGTVPEIVNRQTIPYLLTPQPSLQPRINSPAVTGTHPGSPFLFRIAASGKKPLTYRAAGLPAGLTLDSTTGIISGRIANAGHYKVDIRVRNETGRTQQSLTIITGEELALTPPMGWNSWNCWGINVSAEKVKSSAQALVDKGLIDYGWTYINIDDGWEAAARAADSSIVPNEKFTDMYGLGNWLHGKGLKFGIYSSPGPRTCGGFLGSYRNEQKDAATYASWGVDYLKYDWCSYDGIVRGDSSLDAYIKPYTAMDNALATQKRDILLSLCQYGLKDVWKWGRQVHGQSWRTTEDIEDTWSSLYSIGFQQYPLYHYAGPGHWNDPDMMIVGKVGWGTSLHPTRLTPDEQYTHVSLWSMLSAPLLIGCDLSRLDVFTLNLLTNAEVLALDQDVLGKQAQRVIDSDSSQVWVKELADGSHAIALFNMGTTYRTISVAWKELGMKDELRVRDIWRQKDLGRIRAAYNTVIAPHGVLLLKVNQP
jgi:alpha-galactosidase